jgi:hypothetical protein
VCIGILLSGWVNEQHWRGCLHLQRRIFLCRWRSDARVLCALRCGLLWLERRVVHQQLVCWKLHSWHILRRCILCGGTRVTRDLCGVSRGVLLLRRRHVSVQLGLFLPHRLHGQHWLGVLPHRHVLPPWDAVASPMCRGLLWVIYDVLHRDVYWCVQQWVLLPAGVHQRDDVLGCGELPGWLLLRTRYRRCESVRGGLLRCEYGSDYASVQRAVHVRLLLCGREHFRDTIHGGELPGRELLRPWRDRCYPVSRRQLRRGVGSHDRGLLGYVRAALLLRRWGDVAERDHGA